jgi:hypothetical protein
VRIAPLPPSRTSRTCSTLLASAASLLRQTRLAELIHRFDPRLVAAAFGITPEGALHYLIGAVDTEAAAFANL